MIHEHGFGVRMRGEIGRHQRSAKRGILVDFRWDLHVAHLQAGFFQCFDNADGAQTAGRLALQTPNQRFVTFGELEAAQCLRGQSNAPCLVFNAGVAKALGLIGSLQLG